MSNRNLSDRPRSRLIRGFGDLNVRPKLMVLHNLFFLVLTCAAYFSLIPLFENLVADARAREVNILRQLPGVENQDDLLKQISITQVSYDDAVNRARWTLFVVLGSIYVLAVAALESYIMPVYVYRPIRRMLEADAATQRGDRERELIPEGDILGDEIGQIMRSRNATVEELRRHEDELAAALRRLEDQDRLVSLGLLAASVAHELNTPLAVLSGSIEKLNETAPDDPTRERLSRMQRVTKRLRMISEGLVGFARARTEATEPLDLRHLIEESWTLVGIDEKAASVKFTDHVDPTHFVLGNADRLIQVFVNLLRNSLNAVSSGGKIEVRSRRVERQGNPWIAVVVEDDGPGIPEGLLPGIFDAFVTSRLDARGTGLGLTVAEGIVTQHGGTISAVNRPEGGACLEVALPAVNRASRS